jgi:hypothetical protein
MDTRLGPVPAGSINGLNNLIIGSDVRYGWVCWEIFQDPNSNDDTRNECSTRERIDAGGPVRPTGPLDRTWILLPVG